MPVRLNHKVCLLYTSDAADDMQCVDLGGRRIIKKDSSGLCVCGMWVQHWVTQILMFFNETATTEIYTLHIVGSVRCV